MHFAFLLSIVVGIISIIYLCLRRHYNYWARKNVPHEKPIFFVGNMSGLGRSYHFCDINRRIYQRFKGKVTTPIVGFYTFFKKAVFVLDLDLIKQIMIKDFSSFPNRGLFHNVRDDPLTGNLLFLDGEPWRILRHKLSPVFTTGKMKCMFATLVDVSEQLVASCQARINEAANYDVESIVVDVKDLCARYTTDVIGRCAFGIECNSLRDPNAQFRRMGRLIFEQPRHSLPVQAWMFATPELARKFRLKNFRDDVSAFFMGVVRETVKYRESEHVKRNDFIDLLLELKAKRDSLADSPGIISDDLNNGLTLEQLAAQAMLFFLAGFETSSTTLAFCLYELALNEDVQTKLRKEILEVLDKHEGQLNYESIKEMTYLDQTISETLRKYSVLPHLVRKATVDYEIPGTPITIERGMTIIIPVDSIHNDPILYPEPDKFLPERFTPAESAKRHPFAYLPFGDGPRNCIGMRFGKMQVEIGLIALLRNFSLSPAKETSIPIKYSKKSFLVMPDGGVPLRVTAL